MTATIDKLEYKITGNTSKYDSAVSRSHKKTAAFDGAVVKLGGAMSGLIPIAGGLAGTAALGGLVSVLADGVKSMSDWEQRTLRTEALIKATGNAAGLTADELARFANKLDLSTLGNRDNIMDAINAMQTFKSVSGTVFKDSIRLAMDLSEVFGTDVSNQAMQLGKALEDPITGLTALRRVGVSFTEEQKNMIRAMDESGRKADAQRLILKALEEQVGGAAGGAASGLAGSVDTLSYRWREFKETLATSTPVFDSTATVIDLTAQGLERMTEAISDPQVQEFFSMLASGMLAGLPSAFGAISNIGGGGEEGTFPIDQDTPGYAGYAAGSDGNGVGMGGPDPQAAIEAWQTEMDLDVERWRIKEEHELEFYEAKAERDAERYESMLMAAQAEMDLDTQRYRIRTYWEDRAHRDMLSRIKQQDKLRKGALKTALGQSKYALKEFGKNNESAMKAYKAIAITETTINTAKAAMGAYSALSGIPYVGPVLGALAAAAAIAYGAAQISAIQSESSGGGSPSSGGGVGTYPVSPDTGMPDIDPAESQEERATMHIHIEGPLIGDDQFIDEMVDKINDAGERDVFIEYSKDTVTNQ